MKGYSELYLNDARQNLGEMIEYAVVDLGFEPDVFFSYFISSGIADKFGKGNPKFVAGMSGIELAECVLKKVGIEVKSRQCDHTGFKGIAYWSGWILAYYQYETGKRFEDIVNGGLTLSSVFSMYILHEADESKFIQTANEIIARNNAEKKTKLSVIRKARGFTQAELAKASGISLRMIQLYEQKQNDINKAQVDTVLALCKALGCDMEDLVE